MSWRKLRRDVDSTLCWNVRCLRNRFSVWENINVLGKGKDLKTGRGVKKISRKMNFSKQRIVSWFRRLVAGLSLQSSGFDSKPVLVGFVVNEAALEQVFLWRHRFPPLTMSQPVLLMPSSIADAIETLQPLQRRAFFRLNLKLKARRVVSHPTWRRTIR